MTHKEKVQVRYSEVTGKIPMDIMTVKQLEAEMDGYVKDKQSEAFPQRSAGMFWKNPTFFLKFGTVTGAVTAEQETEWDAVTPKESDIMDKVLNYDPIAKRITDAKAKMRKRAGLPKE